MENSVANDGKGIHPILILKEGIRLWMKNWLFMAKIYLLIHIPLILLNGLVVFKGQMMLIVGPLVTGFISWILGSLVFSTLILWVRESSLGKEVKIFGVFKDCLKKYFLRYLSVTAIYNFIIFGAMLMGALGSIAIFSVILKSSGVALGAVVSLVFAAFFFVTAVYFGVRLSLCGFSCVLDGSSIVASLKTSHSLIKQHANPVIGIYLLIFLAGFLSMIPVWLLGVFPRVPVFAKPAVVVYTLLSGAILTSISTAIIFIMHNKLRENK